MVRERPAAPSMSPSPNAAPPRRPDVQGLRGIAVAVVVAFHVGLPMPGGFVGVDVFFVISGFVITSMLEREWTSTGRIDFRRFYLRRFQRLTPALALMVSITVLASTMILSPVGPQQIASQTGLGAMFLSANVVIAATTGGYFDQAAELNPLLHTWSLSIEEQFYFVFPLFLIAAWAAAKRDARKASLPLGLVALVGVCSFVMAVVGSSTLDLPGAGATALGFYSPFTRAWEFAAGAALALVATRRAQSTRRIHTLTGLLGIVLLVCSFWLISGQIAFPGVVTLMPVAAAALLIHAGRESSNLVSRALGYRALSRIGDLSYSIYLWHWPFLAFAGVLWPGDSLALLVAGAVSVAPALLSYRWVEQPIRALSLSGWRRARPVVAVVVSAPVLVAVAALAASANGYWDPSVRAFQASKTPHHAALCDRADNSSFCRWNVDATGHPIYLVGDSHAGHFAGAALKAAKSLERPVAISMSYNCPFVRDLEIALADETSTCRMHNDRLLDSLMVSPPGVVIIAGADNYWTDDRWSVKEAHEPPLVVSAAKISVWETALRQTVKGLEGAGHSVLIVQTVPLHKGYDPARCTPLKISSNGCTHVQTEADALQSQGSARAVVSRVTSQTNSAALDLWDYFCSDGRCATMKGTTALYTNWSHISVSASDALGGRFAHAIRARSLAEAAAVPQVAD